MMRLSSAIAVLTIVVAAASAGLYPATTGSKGAAAGRTKSGTNHRDSSGDSFHVQSPDGQYVFGHTNGDQGRAEMRDSDGTVTGYYSYTDRDGRVVRVDYVADKGGYRVISNSGVQSASVTVQADGGGGVGAQSDFRKLYSDLTRRIKNTVVQRGQQVVVDPIGAESQQPIVVDPIGGGRRPVVMDPISHPTEETKHSNHEEEKNDFPDWNQVKISTTQKSTDGIEHGEGQQQQQPQQQETVDPNLDSVKITTQKSDIKENDNKGQESIDEWKSGTIIATEMPSLPLVPVQPQIKGNDNDGQESIDEWKSGTVIATEMPSLPLVPIQPQIKGNDNEGQESINDWKNGMNIATEMPSLPFVPIQPQIKGNDNEGQESIEDWKSGMNIATEMPSLPLVPIQPQIKGNDNNGQESIDEWKSGTVIATEIPSLPLVPIQPQIKGNDNNGQESIDDWKSGTIIATEIPSLPLVPIQPQVPTSGDHKGGYSDTVLHEDQAKEITTEIGNSERIGAAESTAIDDTENNSPVTKPISSTSSDQTTPVSRYDVGPGPTTESSDGRMDLMQTTISGVKQFDEYPTAVIAESATDHYQTITENEDRIKISSETDVQVTVKPLEDNESFENVPTTVEPSSLQTDDVRITGSSSSVEYATIETVNGNPSSVSTLRPSYESDTTTSQTELRVGDTAETATAAVDAADVQYVTEQQNNNNEDRPEFRTLEPTESIGSTARPADYEHSQQQEEQEIVWPEIPQESVPQVLVPLNPYPAEDPRPKNAGVKTQLPNDSRPARHDRPEELKSAAVNGSEIETTTSIISDEENDGAMFNFPKYYLIG